MGLNDILGFCATLGLVICVASAIQLLGFALLIWGAALLHIWHTWHALPALACMGAVVSLTLVIIIRK